VTVTDATGAHGSTTSFVQRGSGDVLLAWENEAFLALEELGPDQFEIVVPSVSIWPSRHWPWSITRLTNTAPERWRRPISSTSTRRPGRRSRQSTSTRRISSASPEIELITVDETFRSWQEAQSRHFADGGVFHQIACPGSG
jgi:sulfate/thiosulfate transport system substrate-binding protein